MFEHHLVERRVIAILDQRLRLFLVERPRLLHELEERAPAVDQMRQPVLDFSWAGLMKAGYKGVLPVECGTEEQAVRSLAHLTKVLQELDA